ncbi:serine/threonine-protein kinase ATR-like [Zingiber officinale]|uniref:Serine/threonine-protein kinase ATR n=1 Tax=Zingiber officinale TaxID=94328 RepID=A0A8J5M0F3_ZINOF|nr:serine/threonine-protein kinase ATR-like [Zingiber officinale]KAG6530237.1 hypothetical protein ZIOFF_012460 [Zingiber officinale]
MANISSLIRELREFISTSRSASIATSSSHGQESVEAKLSGVLPDLLQAYIIPLISNEREVTAVLNLLSFTAQNYPGVFFHGRAAGILPVVGRLLPFLTEPSFSFRHGVVFETIDSLLALLRIGEPKVYRQFFLDVIRDVPYISTTSDRVSLKCFSESFALISDCPVTFSELPVCCRPLDGPGVLIVLTDKERWQPFAAWTIRLINKCLMEGTLNMEGLFNASFVHSVCSFLLGYEDATLHMACFDFARITTKVINADIIPVEYVIRSIACILCFDENKSAFRNTTYDSCMGACLHLLHSCCPTKIIESTASEIINAFTRSICSTESRELQLALCNAYVRIAKSCHPQIWEPSLLVKMLYSEIPYLPLIQCIQAALSILISSDTLEGEVDASASVAYLKSSGLMQISSNRSMEINPIITFKIQKIAESNIEFTSNFLVDIEQKKKFANELWNSICSFLANLEASPLKPERTITALSLLCLAFSAHPRSKLSSSIFHQNLSWIPWTRKQAKDSSLLASILPTYLHAIHNILCLQDLESREKLFHDDEFLTAVERSSSIYPKYIDLLELLKLPSELNKVIHEARESTSLNDQLQDAVDGLNHESLNVRYMVACELSKLLNLKREEVTALIAGDFIVDLDVIRSLISSLLRGCAEESRTAVGQRLKLVCGDCLGALGAIDPAKFKGISSERFKIECSDDDLIFELIQKHLARAFRVASDTIVQDSAALAIQELLKLAGCQASLSEDLTTEITFSYGFDQHNEINIRGQTLWDRFSNYVKEIIAPCLTSRFQLPVVSDSTFVGPVYYPSMSFRQWIFFWIRKLTAKTTGPHSSIFNACLGIVQHDMQTAAFLLPYLVLNVVCHGTLEARHSITEEILSVLNAAALGHSVATLHEIAGEQSELCVQAVFTLLDNLGQWVDDLKQEPAPSWLKVKSEAMVNVSELLASIPKVTLAKASFRCQAHARALMYFESHVREKSGSFNPVAVRIRFDKPEKSSSTDSPTTRSDSDYPFADEDISFLMEIYSGLDQPDGLSGLANLRKTSKLQDQLLINEKAGNWAEVLMLCEQALQMEPSSVQRHSDYLNCLLNMCHLQAMVTHVDGLISRMPQYKETWSMQGVQAAWRLGRWDLMDEYLSSAEKDVAGNISESIASFDLGIAKIIQAMMKKDQLMVAERIAQSKQALLGPLAAAGMDSYVRAYPYIVKLHMLCELEDYSALLGQGSFLETSFTLNDPKFIKMTKHWENRLKFTQPSLWAREPLLALRRLVFSANSLSAQVGNCWLQYAKLCRSAGHYETAHHAIFNACASGAPNVHMEKAKLLWSTGKSDQAIAELQAFIPNPVTAVDIQASKVDRDLAKTILLYTKWIHSTGQKQKEEIMNNYVTVRKLQPKWEQGLFFMAKYFDDLLVDARRRQEDNLASRTATSSLNASTNEKACWSYLPAVLMFYAKGLYYGHKNLFEALPRLLTLWFEFGSICQRDGSSTDESMQALFVKISGIMRGCLKNLPTYQWLTVLSQLVSRICHENKEIVRIVKCIITSVLQKYPQQVLWTMAAVSKSAVAARCEAAAQIIQAARTGSENRDLFIQFDSLIGHLIKLCFHPGQPKSKTLDISTEFSALKRMMPLDIILPVQQALTVTLPIYDTSLSADSPSFDVFSTSNRVMISDISDEAEILSSLQRPKKVVFIGSDGFHHPFLCKPNDDLRKDARMMEFTSMINRLFFKFPESRKRKLYIRTFAVTPLTEDCGLVEWVPHTRGIWHILQDLYFSREKFDKRRTDPKIRNIYDRRKTSEEVMLKSQILPMFPPVFHKWFLTTFSEPASWFRARVAYAHTCAVWSMVGHIVGLGDRHGENILFDSTTGDCIHVDFSCLFDKGLQFQKPELVPFRLTQNMIDGLGITGYKGVFLKACEITLSVLRTNREMLLIILETFLYDPLVEWTESHKSSKVEVQNPYAQRAISNIKARLEGIVVGVGARPSLPLAVEGQVQCLIKEAISLGNLGKMHIWWRAWY